jgi:flagellar basal-body rod protein FlgB
MRFDLDKAFGIHQQAVLLRSRRAEILASNIANADTPNYKARDIDFSALLSSAKELNSAREQGAGKLTATNPKHFSGTNSVSGLGFELKYRQPLQPSLDGNSVDSEFEKAEFARNALQYQVSVNFLSSKIKNIKRALSGE